MPNTVTPHTIFAQDQYNKALYQLLLMLEESGTVKTEAYTDGKGIPSVGVGINIGERGHVEKILNVVFNMDLNSSDVQALVKTLWDITKKTTWAANLKGAAAATLHAELNAAMAAYKLTHPSAPATFTLTESQVKNVFNALVPDFNTKLTGFFTKYGITDPGLSLEKLALLSLAWNDTPGSKTLLGKGLGEALKAGNRAEVIGGAW
jgi:hypothetical protein